MRTPRIAIGLAVVVAGLLTAPQAAAATPRWTGTWEASVQQPLGETWQGTNWSLDGFADQSLRQVVRISAGGSALRVHLSNRYGTGPLQLTAATVAKSGTGAAVRPDTLRPLTFDGSSSTIVPAGADIVSDPAPLPTSALDTLTITLYVAARTGPATFHEAATATTYRASGDHTFDAEAVAFTEESHSWYYLTGVDVTGGAEHAAVAAFGDSITDGVSSTKNENNRYPDQLAERLIAAGRPVGVLNAGIAGNRILADTECCGDSALSRFRRDVLERPGVRTVIVNGGLNDIGFDPAVTSAQLIAAQRALIRAAHDRNVTIIGATITPMKGSMLDSPTGEIIRDEVNHWIRTSCEYDAVIDFERAVVDPNDPDALRAEYDAGDRLHPNDAGLQAMVDAIDLAAL